jgi:hypothetical protein
LMNETSISAAEARRIQALITQARGRKS